MTQDKYAALRTTVARAKRRSYQKLVIRVTLAEELLNQLANAEKRIAELEARKPDLYLCRVNRGGEEVYSPCGKDYPRGRGYIAASSPKGE
ncbi:TPA: hypothetical protein QCK11_004227 [Enterobacter asburiae]|nr:hypothetical protein [Enterobacter asburiae]